ncbi:hypothetical protein MJO28_015162 [Puccinia striiformis f. sp. tritici]|uniref:Uncharacterized protein n=1 Tax=Puccinia striiformis f. sp. tritici TaxID=168172 RepID=A0ACC0DRY8_9BASI|nr:hypothetical protein MJO28_015162 [Puccinia striiformis f. sp. tritici]
MTCSTRHGDCVGLSPANISRISGLKSSVSSSCLKLHKQSRTEAHFLPSLSSSHPTLKPLPYTAKDSSTYKQQINRSRYSNSSQMNGKIYWTAFAVLVATPMSNLAMVVTKIQKPGDVLRPAEGLTHFVPLDDGAEVQFYRYTKPNSRVPSRKEVNMDLTQSEYDEKYHELNPSGSTVDDMALNHSNGEVYYRLKSIQSIEEGSEQAAQVLNLKNKATENGSGVWAVKNHAGETIRCKAKLRSEPKWTFDQNILSGKIASTGLHEDEALKVEVSYPPKTEIQKKNRFRSLLNRSAS